MIGIPLSTYKGILRHIPPGVRPTRTIIDYEKRLLPFAGEINECASRYPSGIFDPYYHCNAFPQEFYRLCTFEELSKIYVSSPCRFPAPQCKLFDEDFQYRIVEKIRSSIWRWGGGDVAEEWNTLVHAYDGIRNFSFELPEFVVTLNYTRGCNPRGWSELDAGLYLDGAFGFMIHYRGIHVMTIGFAFARGQKLLITQVQLRKPKGNRFLYKLPMGRVAYIIALMKRYFSNFRIYLVDGGSLLRDYISQYEDGIACERNGWSPDLRRIAEAEEKLTFYRGEMSASIRSTYDVIEGTWKRSVHSSLHMNNLTFHRIIRA